MDFLYQWQQLIGAFIGAAAPLLLFFVSKFFIEKREHLTLIGNTLLLAINNLEDTDRTILHFINGNLKSHIQDVNTTEPGDIHGGRTFFPLMFSFQMPSQVIEHSTGSGYLDTQILQAYLKSKDVDLILEDARKQFEQTYVMQESLIQKKLQKDSHIKTDPNKVLLENLNHYKNFIEDAWGNKNLPLYLRNLITAYVTLIEFRKMGRLRWQRKFTPISFKYFRNKKAIEDFKKNGVKRVETYLEDKIDTEYKSIFSQFSRNQKN